MARYRSIANQVLLPIAGIQAVTVACVAAAAAVFAVARAENEIQARIEGAAETVAAASFPLTPPITARMKDLTGADFIVVDSSGRTAASSIPNLEAPPEFPRASVVAPPVASMPVATVRGVDYRAFAIRARDDSRVLILTPEEVLRRARRESALPPIVLGVGSLGLMTAVTWWVTARIGRRIGAVRSRVALIAEGDFNELDPGTRHDEIRELSLSINDMCRQLKHMRESIGRTERARLLAQVGAGLAHGLRNSISGARMSIQLHARRCGQREGDESLDVALRQLSLTEGQIRGLLSLGKVEKPRPAPCRIDRLVDEVRRLVEPAARHAGVRLVSPPVFPACDTPADESELQAAILNIAFNAVEATGKGGEVRIDVEPSPTAIVVTVADNGPGPPDSLADRLFEPFVTGKPEGVGLGLALASQAAADHGGELSWERRDGWTVFRLSLSVSRVTGDPIE